MHKSTGKINKILIRVTAHITSYRPNFSGIVKKRLTVTWAVGLECRASK